MTVTVEIDTSRVQGLLNQLAKDCSEGFLDTMKEIGEDLKYSTEQRFIKGVAPDGTPWEGLSAVTLAMRVRRGRGGTKPLMDTKTLFENINYDPQPDSLTIYTNRKNAKGTPDCYDVACKSTSLRQEKTVREHNYTLFG